MSPAPDPVPPLSVPPGNRVATEPPAAPVPRNASAGRTQPPSSPPSPLTVPRRRELQQRFERAWSGLRDGSAGIDEVHDWIAPCVVEDPASALYVDTLLRNLRRTDGSKKGLWLVRGWRQTQLAAAALRQQWREVLTTGPDVLRCDAGHPPTLWALVDAAHASGYRESAWRYAEEALRVAPESPETWRRCGRTLAARGQFALAATYWQRLVAARPGDSESQRLLAALELRTPAERAPATVGLSGNVADCLRQLDKLRETGAWDDAERYLQAAASRWGRDLRLEEAGEELVCARHAEQAAQAERLAAVDPDPAWPLLAAETRDSLARLETEIWAARVLRHPREPQPHAELARRLSGRGDWRQALAAWEQTLTKCDQRTPAELKGEAWLRVAESRQRLRRFDDASEAYRQFLVVADTVAGAVEPSSGEPSLGEPSSGEPSSGEPSSGGPWVAWRRAAREQLDRLNPPPQDGRESA
jgi:tetratricopeptide (TPR) repeat protein